MTTLLFSHAACLAHDTGAYHPERPERLRAVLQALEAEEFTWLERREAPQATIDDLALCHPRDYIESLFRAIPAEGLLALDADTVICPQSGEAALRAAGAVVAAVDAVMSGEARNAFCAVRPPGHHAEPDRAMGFCLFNNAVVGARRAMSRHGAARVAIIDFDVHHGNGSETQARADTKLFYASTHQAPLYPGTGMDNDAAHPNVVNVCLAPGEGAPAFRLAFTDVILPKLRAFAPELVIISAGFDAHARDPLAQLRLSEDDYAWATAALGEVAASCCGGRLVSTLEGGYDLEALARSAAAHVRTLMIA